ncbi:MULTISPECIES: hypothetical protein [unclassified Eikenella]|uniref:hypothetical protein n=1 Tax=unclassified Eikenella TaxID=2639367 RepID=UPI000A622B64|nr:MULTISPECIES: hypothetical protein [unclassified Eikenella]
MQTKLLLPIPTVLLLVGCVVSVGNPPALTAENEESLRMCEKQHARILPQLPEGLPDGKYRWPPGGDRQVVIKNGRPSQLEIFHPNGRVRTRHSYNAQGEIEGWSHGYLSDGTLRLRLLYRNGTVTRLQAYNRAGRLEKDEIIDCATRTRTPVVVRSDGAKP